MLLRRTFPLPPDSGGGGGALAVDVLSDPLEEYTSNASGYQTALQIAYATGGTPPYTYSWTQVSGSGSIGGGTGTSDSTTYSASGTGTTTSFSGVFRVTVTDDAMASVQADFTVTFYFGILPP